MSRYRVLLERLEQVRKAAPRPGQVQAHRACCPVCGGENGTKLSVAATDDGRILIHCFCCGADAGMVCVTLGLKISVLFPEDNTCHFRSAGGPLNWASVAALTDEISSRSLHVAVILGAAAYGANRDHDIAAALELFAAVEALKKAAREAMRNAASSKARRDA